MTPIVSAFLVALVIGSYGQPPRRSIIGPMERQKENPAVVSVQRRTTQPRPSRRLMEARIRSTWRRWNLLREPYARVCSFGEDEAFLHRGCSAPALAFRGARRRWPRVAAPQQACAAVSSENLPGADHGSRHSLR